MLSSLSLLWFLLKPHIGKQRKLLLVAVLLTAGATACSLAASWQLKALIDLPKPGGNLPAFVLNVSFVGATYLAAFMLWAGQQTLSVMASERVFIDVKTRLLSEVLSQPRSFFDDLWDAHVSSRLQINMRAATVTFRDDVMAGLFEVFFIFLIICSITVVNWRIGAWVVLGLLICISILKVVNEIWLKLVQTAYDASGKQEETFLDILAATRDIRVFNLTGKIEQQFLDVTDDFATTKVVLYRFGTVVKGFFGLLGALALLLLVSSYGALIIQQSSPKDATLTAGELLVVVTIATLLLTTLNQVLLRVSRLVAAHPGLVSLVSLMTKVPGSRPPPLQQLDAHALIPDQPSIDFLNITYSRTPGTPLFNKLTLQIAAGEKVALVGASGTGKSVLLDLLMRLREPQSGEILYSGIDIRHIESALYYSAFGFVGQQSHIMQLTLREFLQQGWPGQSDDDLWRVLRLFKLSSMVQGLPKQLDTPIGYEGWAFSSGQRQRLAVARAMLRDPQVLVLDDFTSSLDAADELELVRDVLAQCEHRTVICTTYSTAVSQLFERVVTL